MQVLLLLQRKYKRPQRRLAVYVVPAFSLWVFRSSISSEWENLMATDSAVVPFLKRKHTHRHSRKNIRDVD